MKQNNSAEGGNENKDTKEIAIEVLVKYTIEDFVDKETFEDEYGSDAKKVYFSVAGDGEHPLSFTDKFEIVDIRPALLNSEQEQERSAATKPDSSNPALAQKNPSDKEEWREDDLSKVLDTAFNDLYGKSWNYQRSVLIKLINENVVLPRDQEIERLRERIKALEGELAAARDAVEILTELCALKKYKDAVGKDSHYESEQPLAWKRANDFLNGLASPPTSPEESKEK
jgi:hypothetical protein